MSEGTPEPGSSGLYRADAIAQQFRRDDGATPLDPSPTWSWAMLAGGSGFLAVMCAALATASIDETAIIGGTVHAVGNRLHVSAPLSAEAAAHLRAGTRVTILSTGDAIDGIVVSASPGPAAPADCELKGGRSPAHSGLEVTVSPDADVPTRNALPVGATVRIKVPLGRRRLSEVLVESMRPQA